MRTRLIKLRKEDSHFLSIALGDWKFEFWRVNFVYFGHTARYYCPPSWNLNQSAPEPGRQKTYEELLTGVPQRTWLGGDLA